LDLFPRDTILTDVFDNAIIWTVVFAALILLVISLLYLRKNNFHFYSKYSEFLLVFYMVFMGVVGLFAILSDVYGEIVCNMSDLIRKLF
jgi:hypothetical protein